MSYIHVFPWVRLDKRIDRELVYFDETVVRRQTVPCDPRHPPRSPRRPERLRKEFHTLSVTRGVDSFGKTEID